MLPLCRPRSTNARKEGWKTPRRVGLLCNIQGNRRGALGGEGDTTVHVSPLSNTNRLGNCRKLNTTSRQCGRPTGYNKPHGVYHSCELTCAVHVQIHMPLLRRHHTPSGRHLYAMTACNAVPSGNVGNSLGPCVAVHAPRLRFARHGPGLQRVPSARRPCMLRPQSGHGMGSLLLRMQPW